MATEAATTAPAENVEKPTASLESAPEKTAAEIALELEKAEAKVLADKQYKIGSAFISVCFIRICKFRVGNLEPLSIAVCYCIVIL